MKRSLHRTIVTIVMGLLLIPAVMYAQSDQAEKNNPTTAPQGFKDTLTDKHSFIVKLRDEVSSILEKMKSKIAGNGGIFEGNTKYGCFQGKSVLGLIKGEYRSISDTEVEITIKDKPFIIPYKTIEARIKEQLI